MRGVEEVRKSIHQSWWAKGLGLGLGVLCWGFKGNSLGRGLHFSNRVRGISTRTINQATTLSLSQTIWPRWASRQFLTLPNPNTFYRAFQKLLERYNKCIVAGGDYFEGDLSFMCVLSIKVTIRKKVWKLIICTSYVYIYIYIYIQMIWIQLYSFMHSYLMPIIIWFHVIIPV